jgi:hypothetical protein
MSFAWIHLIFVPLLPHFSLLSPYVLTQKQKGVALCLAHDLLKSSFLWLQMYVHITNYIPLDLSEWGESNCPILITCGKTTSTGKYHIFDFSLWSWCQSYVITMCA